jgi:hypothetical protein
MSTGDGSLFALVSEHCAGDLIWFIPSNGTQAIYIYRRSHHLISALLLLRVQSISKDHLFLSTCSVAFVLYCYMSSMSSKDARVLCRKNVHCDPIGKHEIC